MSRRGALVGALLLACGLMSCADDRGMTTSVSSGTPTTTMAQGSVDPRDSNTSSTTPARLFATGARNVRDYGAKGDGVTDDSGAFARCLAVTPAGGTMYVPSGTYRVAHSLSLKSDVTMRGDGPSSRIVRPSAGVEDDVMVAWSVGRVVIEDMSIESTDGTESFIVGIRVSDSVAVILRRLTFKKLGYAMKIDGGVGPNSDLEISACAVLETWMPVYVSHTSDSRFSDLELEAYRTPASTVPHNVYLASGNHNLQWDTITCTGGLSYCFQLYNGSPTTDPSDQISVKNLIMRGVSQGIVVGNGFEEVVFDGITGSSDRLAPNMGWIDLQRDTEGGSQVGRTFRHFDFSGGALLTSHDTSGGPPGPVLLEHGVMRGLDYFPPDGVNHEDVEGVTLIDVTYPDPAAADGIV